MMLLGYRALLIPLAGILVFFIVGCCAWHDWRGERKPIRRWVAGFFFVAAILMSTKVVRQLSFRHELHALRTADVVAIRINGKELASPNIRDEVVAALNASTFLDPHDGGPLRPALDLEIRLRSVANRHYSVARYHYGASIISGAKDAFSSDLVAALERAGEPLPDWPNH